MAAGTMAAPGTSQTQPAAAADQAAQAAAAPAVPFIRGSGKSTWKAVKSFTSQALTTATQDFNVDIKAYDYMRDLEIEIVNTANGGATGTAAADAPFNYLTNIAVLQPNGQTMYNVKAGHHAAMIQKYGMSRANCDPREDPNYLVTGSSATFRIRIPFELDLRDGLGALPNKDAAAPFNLNFSLNTLTNVFGSSQGTSPTFTINIWLDAYDQPPTTLSGQPVQTTPPNMNTLQRWTQQDITISTGDFDARVRKLGNYVREIIWIMKNSSLARIGGYSSQAASWIADPAQIILDEDPKDNISQASWFRRTWETWGYGAIQSGTAATLQGASNANIAFDTSGGLDTGVYVTQYFCNTRTMEEEVNLYLPTIESEDYLLRGSYGSNCYKMSVLVGEVLPQGNIFVM
jgi:hypothetical protein